MRCSVPHICLFASPACVHAVAPAKALCDPWDLAIVDVYFLYCELKIMSD